MEKIIDFSKSIHDLCKENPEVAEVMQELGFESITNPVMLNTAGRVMTIPKGAAMKGVDIGRVKMEFSRRGYKIREEKNE